MSRVMTKSSNPSPQRIGQVAKMIRDRLDKGQTAEEIAEAVMKTESRRLSKMLFPDGPGTYMLTKDKKGWIF